MALCFKWCILKSLFVERYFITLQTCEISFRGYHGYFFIFQNGIFRARKPLLHASCERGAWKCTEFLIKERSDEIHILRDEYYPIHYTVLHESKFLELLIDHGADTTVRTCTQQMTLLHVVLLVAHKSAEDTIATIRLLLDHGCKELINTPDSLGNTPLHALIVRYEYL